MRHYYVSMKRGKRTALLAGPFDTHEKALELVGKVTQAAYEVDPWLWFDLFGTCSLPAAPSNPRGKLNSQLGVDSP